MLGLLITAAGLWVLNFGLTGKWWLLPDPEATAHQDRSEAQSPDFSAPPSKQVDPAEPADTAPAPAGMIYRWEDSSGSLAYGAFPPPDTTAELIAMNRALSIVPGRKGSYTASQQVNIPDQPRQPRRRWSLTTHREKLLGTVKRECRWPMGKAWEEERNIAKVENPAESIWMDPYCDWIAEISDLRCRVGVGDFAYEQYCPRWRFVGRPALR